MQIIARSARQFHDQNTIKINYNKAPRLWVHIWPSLFGERLPFPLLMTRSKSVKIRLTEEEHRKLKSLAGSRGISEFLRYRALGPDRWHEQVENLALLSAVTRARNSLGFIALQSQHRPLTDQLLIVLQLTAVERELAQFKKP